MTTKHTPGIWAVGKTGGTVVSDQPLPNYTLNGGHDHVDYYGGHLIAESIWRAEDRALIAAAPELLEALIEAVDLAWVEDSHAVQFDSTVVFSPHYDFSNLERATRQEFLAQYDCVVWPGAKWSAYCTYEGSIWFEEFDTAEEAKEACMRLLDRVLPEHPAMRARAVARKAKGEQQ